MSDARVALAALPKAELHVHLDGSLRPATMIELATERGVELPAHDADALARHMLVDDAASLEEYLERFALTLSVMQDAEAIERIAYELALDHHAETVRYLEVRFAPVLNAEGDLESHEALEAALTGLDRAREETGIEVGTIVCALRSLPPAVSLEMAELAVAYRDRGVCAFDLAGAEAGNPVRDHAEAFRTAGRGEVPITIHAGEGFGAPSVRQALEIGGAQRIGHGTRLREDPELMGVVRDRRIPIEVCLTSNVQTGVAPTHAAHPVRQYFDEGLVVSLCTDNRLMSGVTLTDEYVHAAQALDFTPDELRTVARYGFEAAFAPEDVRGRLVAELDADR